MAYGALLFRSDGKILSVVNSATAPLLLLGEFCVESHENMNEWHIIFAEQVSSAVVLSITVSAQ